LKVANLTKTGFTAGISAFTSAKRIEVKVMGLEHLMFISATERDVGIVDDVSELKYELWC
jgi:hypothetical protein